MNMLLLYLLIIWKAEGVPEHPFNMYNINSHYDGYCLLTYKRSAVENLVYKRIHQTTSYCLRISEEDNYTAEFNFQNPDDLNFTFIQLKEQGITSQMLLSWSATIDLAEQYEIFLHSDLNASPFNETVLFHNCTSPWFGPLCRFTFDYGMDTSFEDIVDINFKSKPSIIPDPEVSCYKHLHCQTILPCLDWREICNRKRDCFDGSDERDCWQLEINDCNENEFRCHNGLCIPMEFFHDADTDCLDRTDELFNDDAFASCVLNPGFQCEEHMCGPHASEFACGDGQCNSGIEPCKNERSHLLPSVWCAYAVACQFPESDYYDDDSCEMLCSEVSDCVAEYCPEFYDFHHTSVLLGHVRLIYLNNGLNLDSFTLPDYVCYDEKLCADFLPATEHFNNWTCRRIDDLRFEHIDVISNYSLGVQIMQIKNYFRACLVTTNETLYCNYSTMYQCRNSSKCISKQRLLDSLQDCPYNDDETYDQSCSLSNTHQRYTCAVDGIKKCFASLFRPYEKNNCRYSAEANYEEELRLRDHIDFRVICDGKTDLIPVFINEQNETDETNCEPWACNNTYSRCDQFWLCKDGADEVDCEQPSICPALHHKCVFPNDTSRVSCLPIAQAGNDFDDCLGGTDERKKYLIIAYDWTKELEAYGFHCWNDTKSVFDENLCDEYQDCRLNDDELFCKSFAPNWRSFCSRNSDFLTDVENFLCMVTSRRRRPRVRAFKIVDISNYPLQITISDTSFVPFVEKELDSIDDDETENIISEEAWWCNRGIPIRFRMDDDNSKLNCLCPPSYYGNRCQYQNQRVSLTLQIQVSSDWRKVFTFIITLIDDEKNIESYDYIEYLPVRDCIAKYNIYLLYATRPKNASKHYSVQIDAFNQLTLSYRASWIFPLQFSFLPVHRLPVLLKVPLSNMEPIDQCWPPCIHGQCFPYANNRNSTFCRCQSGWSGIQCNIKYICDCALGSICISDSICLCPRDRFGPRCYLSRFSCPLELCLNGGQCVPMDVRYQPIDSIKSTCTCPEGYTGDRCELRKQVTQIDISFHHKLPIPSSLLIHFIDSEQLWGEPYNGTTVMKKIAFDQYSITFYTLTWFDIAFAQMFNQYYLIILQTEKITLAHISTQIIPSHRCQSIDELFNQTFAKEHLLKRIKYYHLPCQQQSELVCFYDDIHFCLCTHSRTANCLEFHHNKTYDCGGYNYCENEGHCIEENPNCPTAFCVCNQCYFGSRCQFSTKESILSLDIILGYHIRSGNEISEQPTIVKVAIGFTLIIFFFGSMNTFLSLVTFREKATCNVGCGIYLFTSSIISLSIVIVSTVKFWLLLASQIGSINNRLFLQIQCMSLDFLLRSLLSMSDWFSACVAVERVVNVSQGINFNKSKSKQVARWIILIVILSISCTHIYDPLYRRLIDDEDEQRTWCVTQYPSSVQIFNWLLSIFHFSLPFSINCISAVVVIITATRTRSNVQQKKPFKEHLREQLQHHKHLLISPLILVALALPRLIISFLSGCMKSARDSWLYMIGYFISFVPSMMTFVVFVLPSEVYRKEFSKSMKQLWQR